MEQSCIKNSSQSVPYGLKKHGHISTARKDMRMITKELIARINALSRKQRSEGLTDDERAEQQALRAEYLAGIREQVKGLLDTIEVAPAPPETRVEDLPVSPAHTRRLH